MTDSTTVDSSEKVARILSTEFTRYENKNVKRGDTLNYLDKEISADDVLIKVRTQLLNMTTVEQVTLHMCEESIVKE
jgi:hypothetical protein